MGLVVSPSEATDVIWWLGESKGFWVQTGAFFTSAVAAIGVILINNYRGKQKATVELIIRNNTNPSLAEARMQLSAMLADGKTFKDLVSKSAKDHPEKRYVITVVNNYEFIATGIKEGALDREIYKRMSRSMLLNDWDHLCPYVKEMRAVNRNDMIYAEFEWLANEFRDSPIPMKLSCFRRFRNWIHL